MSFIRAKEIPPRSGNWYDYEVKTVHEGAKVRQVVIRYIGKSTIRPSRSSSSGVGIGSYPVVASPTPEKPATITKMKTPARQIASAMGMYYGLMANLMLTKSLPSSKRLMENKLLLTDEEINKFWIAHVFEDRRDRFYYEHELLKAQLSKVLAAVEAKIEEGIWKSVYILPDNKPKVISGIKQALKCGKGGGE